MLTRARRYIVLPPWLYDVVSYSIVQRRDISDRMMIKQSEMLCSLRGSELKLCTV
eukprot:IDg18056t1